MNTSIWKVNLLEQTATLIDSENDTNITYTHTYANNNNKCISASSMPVCDKNVVQTKCNA